VDAWAHHACPPPARPPDSQLAAKAQEASRTVCLKRAMNRAVDKVVLPLKKQKAPAFREWMALQADYNRWMADACAAVEEARWVDLARGERGMGTGYGATENQCLQAQYAWRGFFADAVARGDAEALASALAEFTKEAPRCRDEVGAYQRLAGEAAARAPAQVGEGAERTLTQEDWRVATARLERAALGPGALAKRQCALLSLAVPECEQRLNDSLVAQLDFHDVLPAAPSAPTPSEPVGADAVR
jgi:hypothetical protein